MGTPKVFFIFMILILQQTILASTLSRQKRCIVIQKQSGTHGDSSEGEDDRDVEPRKPEKRSDERYDRRNVEVNF
ncbi:jg20396 [Pararge aegeria aegeria]|uniref:Jg20396 protein n=1 Tax=Pararge aegeria aegeria TaxID=348720 RepID=A0A8S4QDU0_9NEOP|nr:jg20396 [Pararge aegeria aegeria]